MQPRSTFLPGSIRGNVRVCFLQGELTVSYQVGDNTEQPRRLKLDTRGWRVSKRRARSCPSARTYLQMERAGVETSLPNLLHIQEGRMVFGAAESSRNSPPAPRQRHPARKDRTFHTVPATTAATTNPGEKKKKSNSTGDVFCNRPDPASAPLAPHVDVLPTRPHAHVRAHTHSSL